MATSSIFADFVVDTEEAALALIKTFEAFEAQGCPAYQGTGQVALSPEKIRAFLGLEDVTNAT